MDIVQGVRPYGAKKFSRVGKILRFSDPNTKFRPIFAKFWDGRDRKSLLPCPISRRSVKGFAPMGRKTSKSARD